MSISRYAHETPEAVAVFSKLNELLFDFSVLGGYPRDLENNTSPKDIDICIYNFHVNDTAEQLFFAMLVAWLNSNDMIAKNYTSESGGGNDRVITVITLKCDIDLIFWDYKTKFEVLNNFDVNLNQYELDLTTGKPVFHGSNHGTMEFVRPVDMTLERVTKLMTKADNAGWKTCQQIKKFKNALSLTPTPQNAS